MAVLEIQANGDTAVSKEAIVNAGQSLEDPLMRVSLKNTSRPKYIQQCNQGNTETKWQTVLLIFAYTYRRASTGLFLFMQRRYTVLEWMFQ